MELFGCGLNGFLASYTHYLNFSSLASISTHAANLVHRYSFCSSFWGLDRRVSCLLHPSTMRWISLFVICSAVIICLVITPLLLQVQDLLDQYDGYRYLASSLLGHGRHNPQNAAVPPMGDKIIVMASLESEDTSWVAEKLPEYAALNEASPTQGSTPC